VADHEHVHDQEQDRVLLFDLRVAGHLGRHPGVLVSEEQGKKGEDFMKKFPVGACIVVLGMLVLAMSGCGSSFPVPDPENTVPAAVNEPITDYGNGVYYFAVRRAEFVVALSAFIGQHPELELLAMTGNGNGSYGRDKGYFVVFKKKN